MDEWFFCMSKNNLLHSSAYVLWPMSVTTVPSECMHADSYMYYMSFANQLGETTYAPVSYILDQRETRKSITYVTYVTVLYIHHIL